MFLGHTIIYCSEKTQEVISITILTQCLTLTGVMLLDPHLAERTVWVMRSAISHVSVEFTYLLSLSQRKIVSSHGIKEKR